MKILETIRYILIFLIALFFFYNMAMGIKIKNDIEHNGPVLVSLEMQTRSINETNRTISAFIAENTCHVKLAEFRNSRREERIWRK